jgi:hypothetical protein
LDLRGGGPSHTPGSIVLLWSGEGWARRRCRLSYGPPWAHYLSGYQDRLLGGPLGLLDLCHTAPDGVGRKEYSGEVRG